MTINFATPAPILAWAFTCGHDNGVTAHRFDTHQEAVALLNIRLQDELGTGTLAVCGDDDCRAFGRMMPKAILDNEGPSVNMTSGNAHRVLSAMGISVFGSEVFGSIAGAEFAEAARAAIAADDYTKRRLAEFAEIGEYAASTGRPVEWA